MPRKYPLFKEVESLAEIDAGDFAAVFRISPDYVVKVPHDSVPEQNLGKEYYIHQRLFNSVIRVPKPLGIFRVSIYSLDQFPVTETGLVMQFIRGEKGAKASAIPKKEIIRKLDSELQKCLDLGFIPFDEGIHNCLLEDDTHEIYLIDFAGWKFKPKQAH
jgi:RIO-like serine/threonine protein kinase